MGEKAPKMMCVAVVVLAIMLGANAESVAPGQETIVISDQVSCPRCEITMNLEVSLGAGAEKEGQVCGRSGTVAVDSSGRFYVAPTCEPGTINVYDDSGALIETIGRLGQGPGEFAYITGLVIAADDSIHVFDNDRRHTILSKDREYIGMNRTPTQPWQVLISPDRTSIQQLTLSSSAYAGLPLHLVDTAGTVTRSFGAVDPAYRADRRWRMYRSLAWADADSVWSLPFAPYEIELWSTDGHRERLVRRDAAWFPERTEEFGPTGRSLRQDEQGRLWVAIVVPSDAWDGSPPQGPMDLEKMLDTVIEIIEPSAGNLVSSVTVDQVFSWWVGDMLYSYREEGDGNLVIDVWRMQLNQPTEERNSQ